jgi:glutaryl-CoA dehydrogenase
VRENAINDFYCLDELLSAEERSVRERVRQFVDNEALPVIADYFDKGRFPAPLSGRLAEMGLFGTHVPGYGCQPRNETIYGLVCRELGRCDSGLRAVFSVQNSLVMFPIYAFGSEAQRQRWLPQMARGETIGCFGLSEPGFGSDPGGMQTRASHRGDGYVLSGRKMWITNGPIAQVAIVWAKLEGDIRGFIVSTDAPGFKVSTIQRKFAYRTSPTAMITLDNCRVAADRLLPNGRGLKSIFQCLNYARFGVACGATGAAMACFETARRFAGERVVFGRPIGGYQLVQERLAGMLTAITQSQLLDDRLGRLLDQKRATPAQISLAKLANVRNAIKIARDARDILGARGILADHHIMRHLCDLEAVSTLEGTDSMHTLVLGQEITGLSAFK